MAKQPTNFKLFGTDGIRGVANQFPMDSETVLHVGRAAAQVLAKKSTHNRILIGKDTRVSGYMIETALASGISSLGFDVLLVGPLPTPGVAYMTKSMRADAGIIISASHNPYYDNGIKFFGGDGFKLPDEKEAEIENLVSLACQKIASPKSKSSSLYALSENIGKAFRIEDAIGRYTVFLKSVIDKNVNFEGLRIVLDTANGAAYKVAPLVFTELGAKVFQYGDKPDGKNINYQCGSLYPELISAKVKEHGADFGIAFDGDADRVVFCDEKGQILNGDNLLLILAQAFKAKKTLKSNAIVATSMSNLGLEFSLKKLGIKLHRSDVGDRQVLIEMQKYGLNLGGEQSGHVISLDYNTTGDGLLTALLVVNSVLKKGKPLSYFTRQLKEFPQLLTSVKVSQKKPLNEVKKLNSLIQSSKKLFADKGRIVVRYSGTEPLLRIMVECEDELLCKKTSQALTELAAKELK